MDKKTGSDDGDLTAVKSADMTPQRFQKARKYLFRDLPNLNNVVLKENQFSKIGLGVFFDLRNLTYLDLSSNKIDELNRQTTR